MAEASLPERIRDLWGGTARHIPQEARWQGAEVHVEPCFY